MNCLTVRELQAQLENASEDESLECNEEAILSELNEIGPEILNLIDAKGTLWKWCILIQNGCVILPSDLGGIRQMWYNDKPLSQRHIYWTGRLTSETQSDGYEIPHGSVVHTEQFTPLRELFTPKLNETFAVVVEDSADEGINVEIRWTTKAHEPRLWQATTTTAGTPAMLNDTDILDITNIKKPRTKGYVEIRAVNLHTGNWRTITRIEPRDECPKHQIVHITSCENKSGYLTIFGKKRWLPLRTLDDIIPFGSTAVWRWALYAQEAARDKETEKFNSFLIEAIRLLENEKFSAAPKGISRTVNMLTPWSQLNKSPFYY